MYTKTQADPSIRWAIDASDGHGWPKNPCLMVQINLHLWTK